MGDMAKRVAKAIADYWLEYGFDPSEPNVDLALAAIKAMREPSSGIIKYHHVVPDDTNFDDRVADNWRNLIDALTTDAGQTPERPA